MATSTHIPRPLLEAVDHKDRTLERELKPGLDWSPGFFEKLGAADSETVAAVDELLASVRQARTSKPPRSLGPPAQILPARAARPQDDGGDPLIS